MSAPLASTSRESASAVKLCNARNSVMQGLSTAALIMSSAPVTMLIANVICVQTTASSPAAIATPAVAPKVTKASTVAPAAMPIAANCTTPTMPLITLSTPETTSITALSEASVLASTS